MEDNIILGLIFGLFIFIFIFYFYNRDPKIIFWLVFTIDRYFYNRGIEGGGQYYIWTCFYNRDPKIIFELVFIIEELKGEDNIIFGLSHFVGVFIIEE